MDADRDHYTRFKQDHANHIATLVTAIGGITEDAHWTLIDEMKGVLGAQAANKETGADNQDIALCTAEFWVSTNCSSGGIAEDVAMALWLRGVDKGESFLKENRATGAALAAASIRSEARVQA